MTNFPNRGFYRGDLNAALKDYGVLLVPAEEDPLLNTKIPLEVIQEEPLFAVTNQGVTQTLTSGEMAKSFGYTGDQCSHCNSMKMKMAGHCMVCEDCGETTGCS